jgi:RNA polymerase sigma-70 factor (ECF subfamily)
MEDMTPASHSPDDADLWAQWGRRHGRAVRGYVWAMVRRHDLADDLTQEVFCRAWQARDRYREQGALRAYLLCIADRLVCDHGRKAGREVNLSEEDWERLGPAQGDAPPADGLARAETLGQLAAALDGLSPAQRRVLLLRYYGDLPFSEIAAMMGCPVSTVLSHCRRGLLTLRRLLVEKST